MVTARGVGGYLAQLWPRGVLPEVPTPVQMWGTVGVVEPYGWSWPRGVATVFCSSVVFLFSGGIPLIGLISNMWGYGGGRGMSSLTGVSMLVGGDARLWGFLDARAAALGGGPPDWIFIRFLGGSDSCVLWSCAR